MTYFSSVLTTPKDSPATDAFHRLRVSNLCRQFSAMSEYTDNPLIWENAVVGTGGVAYQPNLCAVRLSTGGTANLAAATRQTRRYMRYMPGKSLLIFNTFVMSAAQTNATAEIGYNDDSNGVFLQRAGSTLNIIKRTFTSGSPSDDATIPQSSWNLDKLNGSGASGITLDVTKTQILVIDLQFLGVGRVRVGFDFGDKGIIYCHQFLHANVLTTAYMSSACLPVRGRVFNTGTATGIVTLDMICCSVANEGDPGAATGDSEGIIEFSASNGITLISTTSTTLIPILSVRAATKLGGGGAGTTTNRGQIIPEKITITATQDMYFEIWLNATLTAPSWIAQNAFSLAEYDVTASAITTTSAYKISSGYVVGAGTKTNSLIVSNNFVNIPLVYTGLNSSQDIITIACKAISTTGTTGAAIDWLEKY
jgi:hypothetical protein